MTARDLIKSTLRLIGVLASGETPSAPESNDSLEVLNGMIKTWGIEGLMVFKTTKEEFSLAGSQQSYTMGPGGDFDTVRPQRIQLVTIKSGGTELPTDILNVQQWSEIINKTSQSNFPYQVYVEGTYPLETINFWPQPSTASTVIVYSNKPISDSLALSDEIALPPGYEECIKYNLAVKLAPEFGRPLDPLIFEEAKELKALVMRQNTKPTYMKTDAPTRSYRFNFERGS